MLFRRPRDGGEARGKQAAEWSYRRIESESREFRTWESAREVVGPSCKAVVKWPKDTKFVCRRMLL